MTDGSRFRLLLLEDEAGDAALLRHHLEAAAVVSELVWARSREEFLASLDPSLDLILADHSLPGMDSFAALELLRQRGLDIPVIVVTGSIDDGVASELLRRGAVDFLLKDRIARLVPAVARAVGERRAAAQSRLAEARYRKLFDLSPDGILVAAERRVRLANQAAARLLGAASPAAVIGGDVEGCIPGIGALLERAGADGSAPVEMTLRRADGGLVEVEILCSRWALGGADEWQIVIRDIGARKESERAMRAAHAEAEHLLSSISAILIGLDRGGRITRWNAAAETLFGEALRQGLGRTPAECQLGLGPDADRAIAECLATGGRADLTDLRYVRADAKPGFLSLAICRGAGGDADREVVILGIDVTARKLLEIQQSHGQKLESIGQLAAGVAHEINTPIQFIGDNLRFLDDAARELLAAIAQQRQLLAGAGAADPLAAGSAGIWQRADMAYLAAEIPNSISQSIEGVERVAKIVKAMKEFSHPGDDIPQPVDLNHALQTTVTVARNEYKYVADVQVALAAHLPAVIGRLGELNQVFLNLVVNAAHAIAEANPGGGGRGLISIATALVDGQAEIRIGDDGTGIPAHVLPRIFDPFFTTKAVGKGTGQGLFLCHGVVQRHGGSIAVETAVGRGTTFIVRIPVRPPG